MSLGSLLLDFIILNQSLIVASIEHLLLLGVHFLTTLASRVLFLLSGVDLLELGLVAEEDLGWMTLAYYVQWLLNIFQDDFAIFFEARYLHFNDFTNAFSIDLDVSNAVIVFDDT
jgi:hypothetical protein